MHSTIVDHMVLASICPLAKDTLAAMCCRVVVRRHIINLPDVINSMSDSGTAAYQGEILAVFGVSSIPYSSSRQAQVTCNSQPRQRSLDLGRVRLQDPF